MRIKVHDITTCELCGRKKKIWQRVELIYKTGDEVHYRCFRIAQKFLYLVNLKCGEADMTVKALEENLDKS